MKTMSKESPVAKLFRVNCGNYHHFIVTANTKTEAYIRFQEDSNLGLLHGFTIKDVTSIVPVVKS